MSFNVIYLIPKDSPMSAAAYGIRAKELLLEMGVIAEPDDDDAYERMFVNGDESAGAFEPDETGEDELPFDTGEIFSGPHFTLTPIEYVDGIYCPNCNANLTEPWGRLVDPDDDGNRGHVDLLLARIKCPACSATYRLDQLKGDGQTRFYLTDRYISFYDARWPAKEWLTKFDRQMGSQHELARYWWT